MGNNSSIVNLLESKRLYPDDKRDFDIIWIIGQSNAVGDGIEYSFNDMIAHNNKISSPYIFQLGRGVSFKQGLLGNLTTENHAIQAVDPLEIEKTATTSNLGTIGFVTTIAKAYYETYVKNTNRNVLIVQCAIDASGFSTNDWNPGNRWFNEAVRRLKVAMNLGGNNKVVSIIWHQAETDGINFMSKVNYDIALRKMINTIRDGTTVPGVNIRTPFILGEVNYSDFLGTRLAYPSTEQEYKDIQSDILNISDSQTGLPNTATVLASLDGIKPYENDKQLGLPENPLTIDGKPFAPGHPDLHFSAKSCEILGQRYFNALEKLLQH
jgi:hypothetical protein